MRVPACLNLVTGDPAIDAFVAAQGDRRIRGAFRLAGTVLTLAIVFVLSIDSLQVFHEGVFIVYPVPIVVFWVLGELGVGARRLERGRKPRIPLARVVR